ncbi:MAG: response regulator transcription factor [Spirochaetia bacterium]|nr:response regulator transcription factor [Spirochaetia bacterium]
MSYNLLLVDDDAEFRSEFCECFETYNIIQAAEGEAALTLLVKPNVIDLVLLDVMLPGIQGTEVLAEMKRIKPDIKIVMITNNRSRDVVIESLKNRADEYIEKPINVEETRQIIVKLLNEKESKDIPDTGNIQAKIKKVEKLLERNFDKKVSLEQASDHVGLSTKYLSRAFEDVTHTGFSDYKSAVKVKKAQELLKQGFNINQISDKLAYANAESFIRTFKKIIGCTPAIYRDRQSAAKHKTAGKKRRK